MSAHSQAPRSDRVAAPARRLLVGGRPASRWLIRRRYDVRVRHPERFPVSGPVVVAGNHVGFVDGPLMAIFAPRPVHALTKEEMFAGPLGWFLRRAGQVPLDRQHTDPRAVRTALRVLRDGHAVGVFPEGSRGAGDLEIFHTGAAYLALVTGAPVVPLTFLGTREPGGSSELAAAAGGSDRHRRGRTDARRCGVLAPDEGSCTSDVGRPARAHAQRARRRARGDGAEPAGPAPARRS
ncbi:lysophospholipid acyltransferase family protein [Nocardioides convexus]|uniref:lysophospholipid acyltransferase family protein n=1 Tax=Nocardioides convexus TaxID=2712224 RepID=UPI00241880EC|nr:lysophospholipid acyltransferase family protein [Nocardioides convexus]